MRKLFFPLALFGALVLGGLVLQQEAGQRRKALEESVGGSRIGVSLETAAAFARQLETIRPDAPAYLQSAPLPNVAEPAIARNGER